MSQRKKIRLGDLLIEHKVISEAQLGIALAEQKKTGRKLGHTLIENGFIDEEGLLQFLSQQLDLPFIDLVQYQFKPDTIRLLPEIHARRFRAIALEETPTDLLVGMADPTNILAFDELSRMLNRPLRLAVVRETDLLRTIDMSTGEPRRSAVLPRNSRMN